ncbi:aldehyde dehydrogenase family protein [Gordonia humi]|uniref:Acyl-CoA reductase-like NAD-dependent aldehyde dehydrogenase n=1 Tax=Gordonia humi TaxID=686429 RepID=A0A840EV25_9ACTN|nr:aldehyde dehydrogenase family protein [Gordonia humi]MBB4133696.1 acyl-CoA reductase-like NAD-dependent aldehyde dehydrogenase [Gordonia humi]
MPHYRMFIDGEHVDTDESFDMVNPSTGEVWATVAKGTTEHVDAAVEAAQRAFESSGWRDTPMADRADLIDRAAARLADRLDELSALAAQENGVPVRLAAGLLIGMPIMHAQHFAEMARSFEWEAPVGEAGLVRKEPFGVVAGIVPWNVPLVVGTWKVIPAIATGNSVILKVDEKTPITELALAEALTAEGLPPGVLNIVTGDAEEVGNHISAHPGIRKVSYTGSTPTGRTVMRHAAENVKALTLELGGKGANIVLEDADLDRAVDGSLWAFLVNAGQACESGTRLLLPESIHDEFVDRMIARMKTLTIGDSSDPATDLGPVVNARQRDRISHYLEIAEKEGATVAYGGTLSGPQYETGYWIHPTVLTDVTNDMKVAAEEIFGPVVSVLKYSTVEEAISIANDTEYGLSAGVWSTDNDRALDIARRLDAGTVWINDWHVLSGQLPFGGFKQSGFGREMGPNALDEYTQEKAISFDDGAPREEKLWQAVLSTPPSAAS